MPSYVAFLRAVNVGKRQVRMASLRTLLEAEGYEEVETHIQSGNLKVRSGVRSAAKVEADLRRAISDEFGFDVPVVVRTPAQLRTLVELGVQSGQGYFFARPGPLPLAALNGGSKASNPLSGNAGPAS